MKQLYHKFITYPTQKYLLMRDNCIYCGKSSQSLLLEVDDEIRKTWPSYKEYNALAQQMSWLVMYSKCIAEEEYIIKNILE